MQQHKNDNNQHCPMPYDQIASTWKLYSEIDISWSHHDCITLDLHIRGHWPQGPDIVYNEHWPVQQQGRWSSSPLWNVAVTSRVAVTRVAAYGGWPYYGMVTIHAYWVCMAWYGMVYSPAPGRLLPSLHLLESGFEMEIAIASYVYVPHCQHHQHT